MTPKLGGGEVYGLSGTACTSYYWVGIQFAVINSGGVFNLYFNFSTSVLGKYFVL